MARVSTARTSGISTATSQAPERLHPTEPSTATDAPRPAPQDAEEPNTPAFNFDNLRRKYPDNLTPVPRDATLAAGGIRSLPSIGTQAFGCGFLLSGSLLLTAYLTLEKHNPIWRVPAFLACLALFHFMEFWTTARYNPQVVRASSFLIFNNGRAYQIAHSAAMMEILVSCIWFPRYQQLLVFAPVTVVAGLLMVAVGQIVRSVAMCQAGENFNHTPVQSRKEGHVLVTHGLYRWSRHPSYFGFFWWALGTQVLVGNKVCLIGYAIVLWRFFYSRIKGIPAFDFSFDTTQMLTCTHSRGENPHPVLRR